MTRLMHTTCQNTILMIISLFLAIALNPGLNFDCIELVGGDEVMKKVWTMVLT